MSITDVAKQNTSDATWTEYLARPVILGQAAHSPVPQLPQSNPQALPTEAEQTKTDTKSARDRISDRISQAANEEAAQSAVKAQADGANLEERQVQLEAEERLSDEQLEEARKKRCLSQCAIC